MPARGAMLAALAVAAALAAAARALPPPNMRVVAGSMPGLPHANPLVYPARTPTAAVRRRLARRFAAIRIGAPGGPAVAALGRIHEIVTYTPGNRCDFFDGRFVLCVNGGRVAAKGYEVS